MELLHIPLASIEVSSDRARDLDPVWAEALAALIDVQGLQHPIRVREAGEGYLLVAGLHRLSAFRFLERAAIPAFLSAAATEEDARLEEVMENLGRYDLIALDRCRHLYELKRMWEAQNPQSRRGGDRGNQHTGGKVQTLHFGKNAESGEVFGFTEHVAEKIGLSRRTVFAAVKIWTELAPASRSRLRGTNVARKQTELKALSELPAAKQVKVLDAILSEELPDVGNVAQAIEYLNHGVTIDPLEKRFQSINRSFAALDDTTFDSIVNSHEDRIVASLKRRGRI